ncbi:MAG: TolC family protein [Candidatus Margulisiibacteriota bacterium]
MFCKKQSIVFRRQLQLALGLSAWLCFTCALPAFAITWSDILTRAPQVNHELKSSAYQKESYQFSYYRSFSGYLPNLSASFSMTGTGATTQAAATTYRWGLSATQNLFTGFENFYSVQSAYANLQYYIAGFDSTTADVYYNLREAFVNLVAAQERVALNEKILERRQENRRMISLRYDSGREDIGNLMQTQASEGDAKYNLSSAKRDLVLAKLKLGQLLEMEVDSAAASLEAKNVALVDFDALLEQTPDYRKANYTLELADIAHKATISGFLPSVYLSGNYSQSGSSWPTTSDNSSVALTVSYSFFPGGTNFMDRAIYGIKLDQAREDFSQTKNDLRYDLENKFESFRNATESVGAKKFSLAAADERAKIARAKYLNGLLSYNDWDIIENTFINAESALLTSQQSWLLAEAAWYKSYGGYIK